MAFHVVLSLCCRTNSRLFGSFESAGLVCVEKSLFWCRPVLFEAVDEFNFQRLELISPLAGQAMPCLSLTLRTFDLNTNISIPTPATKRTSCSTHLPNQFEVKVLLLIAGLPNEAANLA